MQEHEYQTYLFSYQHEGLTWSVEIPATSREDAEQRIQTLAQFGTYDGVLVCKVPYLGGLGGVLVRIRCWLLNLRHKTV